MAVNLVEVKNKTLDTVAARIKELQQAGRLDMPADYSAGNALQSAWLTLQQTTDKNGKLALEVCTPASIYNAMLDMVVMGLNPSKKQAYFIPMGNKLVMMPSYFGFASMAKRVDENIEDIFSEVVYENDKFKYKIERGRKVIVEHEQDLDNVDKQNIKAAYCTILYKDGKEVTTIMTMDEIKQAWKQSLMKPFDDHGKLKAGTTHEKFTAEMCKKTVTRKACKPIINSSNDSYLKGAFNRSSEDYAEGKIQSDIETNANIEPLDIEPRNVVDAEYAEVNESAEAAATTDQPEQTSLDEPGF